MKILFITSTRIGDAIISTTLLNHLLTLYPHAQVTIACGQLPAALFEDLPGLDELIVVKKKQYGQHWFKIWQHTILKCWDIVIDLRGSALSYCLFARKRVVWRSPQNLKTRHAQLLDLFLIKDHVLPKIWTSPQREQKLHDVIPTQTPVIAIAPAANWPSKEWPQEKFLNLINHLTSSQGRFPGARIAIFAAPHEYERLAPLIDQLQDQVVDLSQYSHLLDVAVLLKRCSIFIGNDSGLMHLAAAMGTPTLGLFGPSNDRLYRPTGPCADFVRTPESFEDVWKKVKRGQVTGLMDSLTVDMVLEKLECLGSRFFQNPQPHGMAGKQTF